MADSNDQSSHSLFFSIVMKIITSPLNLALVGVIAFLLYKICKTRYSSSDSVKKKKKKELKLPKLRKDLTVEELRKYNGTQPDGRILIAVNGKIFDVTRNGQMYGPGGPYSALAGRDATRCLAKFILSPSENESDDLSDLDPREMESVYEWEMQFKEKYDYVGKLLKPGEEPTNYSEEEEEEEDVQNSAEKAKIK